MRQIVNNLRKKPAHVRDQIAIFAAMTFAGVVAFFWLTSLSTSYASPETKSSFNESISPFKAFSNNVKNAFSRTKAELSTIDASSPESTKSNGSVTVDAEGVVNIGGPADAKSSDSQ